MNRFTMNTTTTDSLNRSDRVRARRSLTSQERVSRASSAARSTVNTPPVFVRNPAIGSPVINRTKTRARRKYFISIGSSEAEIGLPSIPNVRPGWRLISGLMVFGLLAAIFVALTGSVFTIQQATVNGLTRLSADDIVVTSGLIGTSIFEIEPEQALLQLQSKYPELTRLTLTVGLPNKISISAVERQPVLTWKVVDQTLWVDVEGYIFPARGEVSTPLTINADVFPPQQYSLSILPLMCSSTSADALMSNPLCRRINPTLLSAIQALSAYTPEGTTLAYSTTDGLGWVDSRGWQVFFGQTQDDMAVKQSTYQALVAQLEAEGVAPKMISVANVHAPYYRGE